jgi:hypothetical protein
VFCFNLYKPCGISLVGRSFPFKLDFHLFDLEDKGVIVLGEFCVFAAELTVNG